MPAQGKEDKSGEGLLIKWFKMQERKEQLKVEKRISVKNRDCVCVWVVFADHGVAH